MMILTSRLFFPVYYPWLKFIFPPLLASYAYIDLKRNYTILKLR